MTSRKATNGVLTWAQARVILSVVVPVLIVLITYFVMVGGLQARVQAQAPVRPIGPGVSTPGPESQRSGVFLVAGPALHGFTGADLHRQAMLRGSRPGVVEQSGRWCRDTREGSHPIEIQCVVEAGVEGDGAEG